MHTRRPRATLVFLLLLAAACKKSPAERCDRGDDTACAELCDQYPKLFCHSAPLDASDALAQLERGCDAGDPMSCRFLASRYHSGVGAPLDPEKAKLYEDKTCAEKDWAAFCNDIKREFGSAGPHASSPRPSAPAGEVGLVSSVADVDVALEGQETKLAYGIALLRADGKLTINLADAPFESCDDNLISGPGLTEPIHVYFDVPPGPGAKYFAGKPMATRVGYSLPHAHGKDPFAIDEQTTKITLDPFIAAKGERVRGAIEFHARSSLVQTRLSSGDTRRYVYDGGGRFDVVICSAPATPSARPAQPEAVPDGAVTGTVAGAPFAAKSALAFAMIDDRAPKDDVLAIRAVQLFPDAGMTCANHAPERRSVDIAGIGGANSASPLLNTPMPVAVTQDVRAREGTKVKHSESGLGTGWVALDALELTPAGGHVRGAFFIASETGKPDHQAHLAGHFDAPVCILKLPPGL